MNSLKIRFVHFLLIAFMLLVAIAYDTSVINVILQAISDAYLQVSAFVFAALYIFYALEKLLNINALALLSHKKWEVTFAAFLGALPGCGGAIIVTTQYVRGKQSFGALTAALIGTMGDAAFLLLAREPLTGIMIIVIGFVTGSLFGILVNYLHGADFMRGSVKPAPDIQDALTSPPPPAALAKASLALDRIWLLLMIPAVIFALILAGQIDVGAMMSNVMLAVGVFGGMLCWLMYGIFGHHIMPASPQADAVKHEYQLTLRNFIDDTNFVTVWVIMAFLLFEVSVHLLQFDLKAAFDVYYLFVPLMAILIGFLPGCGPQILVATLYLEGFIPISALLGNAISNDGDALFPALALAKKPAIVATIYSAVPALAIAYGVHFFL